MTVAGVLTFLFFAVLPLCLVLLVPGFARGLDGIGLLAAKESGAVVFVALRIAAGEGEREGGGAARGVRGRPGEAVEEVEQVVGVLPGRVEADDEQHGPMPLGDAFETLAEEGVAGGGLGEGQFGGGGLEVVVDECGVMAVAGRVDADAAASGRWRGGRGL